MTISVRNLFLKSVLSLFLFLLPWQTRFILQAPTLHGGPWEYGVVGIYAVEILLWLAVLLAPKELFRAQTRAWWMSALALLVGVAALSILWAPYAAVSVRAVTLLLEALIVIVLVGRSQSSGRWFIGAFVAGVCLQAILGIMQVAMQWVSGSTLLGIAEHNPSLLGTAVVEAGGGRLLRAYGGLPHPNVFGGYLAAALTFLVLCTAYAKQSFHRALLWGALLVITCALFFTFSRSAWIAFAIGVMVLLGVLRTERKRLLPALFLVFLVFGSLGVVFRDAFFARSLGTGRLETQSQVERVTGMREALAVIQSHPWIGVGVGNYTAALAAQFPGRPSWAYQPVHNVPILVLAELGILGSVPFLLFVIALGVHIIRELRKPLAGSRLEVRAGVLAALLGMSLIVLVDHYVWSLFAGVMLGAVVLGFLLQRFDPRTTESEADYVSRGTRTGNPP